MPYDQRSCIGTIIYMHSANKLVRYIVLESPHLLALIDMQNYKLALTHVVSQLAQSRAYSALRCHLVLLSVDLCLVMSLCWALSCCLIGVAHRAVALLASSAAF